MSKRVQQQQPLTSLTVPRNLGGGSASSSLTGGSSQTSSHDRSQSPTGFGPHQQHPFSANLQQFGGGGGVISPRQPTSEGSSSSSSTSSSSPKNASGKTQPASKSGSSSNNTSKYVSETAEWGLSESISSSRKRVNDMIEDTWRIARQSYVDESLVLLHVLCHGIEIQVLRVATTMIDNFESLFVTPDDKFFVIKKIVGKILERMEQHAASSRGSESSPHCGSPSERFGDPFMAFGDGDDEDGGATKAHSPTEVDDEWAQLSDLNPFIDSSSRSSTPAQSRRSVKFLDKSDDDDKDEHDSRLAFAGPMLLSKDDRVKLDLSYCEVASCALKSAIESDTDAGMMEVYADRLLAETASACLLVSSGKAFERWQRLLIDLASVCSESCLWSTVSTMIDTVPQFSVTALFPTISIEGSSMSLSEALERSMGSKSFQQIGHVTFIRILETVVNKFPDLYLGLWHKTKELLMDWKPSMVVFYMMTALPAFGKAGGSVFICHAIIPTILPLIWHDVEEIAIGAFRSLFLLFAHVTNRALLQQHCIPIICVYLETMATAPPNLAIEISARIGEMLLMVRESEGTAEKVSSVVITLYAKAFGIPVQTPTTAVTNANVAQGPLGGVMKRGGVARFAQMPGGATSAHQQQQHQLSSPTGQHSLGSNTSMSFAFDREQVCAVIRASFTFNFPAVLLAFRCTKVEMSWAIRVMRYMAKDRDREVRMTTAAMFGVVWKEMHDCGGAFSITSWQGRSGGAESEYSAMTGNSAISESTGANINTTVSEPMLEVFMKLLNDNEDAVVDRILPHIGTVFPSCVSCPSTGASGQATGGHSPVSEGLVAVCSPLTLDSRGMSPVAGAQQAHFSSGASAGGASIGTPTNRQVLQSQANVPRHVRVVQIMFQYEATRRNSWRKLEILFNQFLEIQPYLSAQDQECFLPCFFKHFANGAVVLRRISSVCLATVIQSCCKLSYASAELVSVLQSLLKLAQSTNPNSQRCFLHFACEAQMRFGTKPNESFFIPHARSIVAQARAAASSTSEATSTVGLRLLHFISNDLGLSADFQAKIRSTTNSPEKSPFASTSTQQPVQSITSNENLPARRGSLPGDRGFMHLLSMVKNPSGR